MLQPAGATSQGQQPHPAAPPAHSAGLPSGTWAPQTLPPCPPPQQGTEREPTSSGGVSPGAQDGVVTLGGVKSRQGGPIPAGRVRVGAEPQPGLEGQTDNEPFPTLAPEREGFPDRKLTSSNPPSSDPSSRQSWLK